MGMDCHCSLMMCRRSFVGQFLAYDVHMNIVLVHAKEIVTKGIKKDLPPLPSICGSVILTGVDLPGEDVTVEKSRGLVLIRGVNVISVHICGPPPSKPVLVLSPVFTDRMMKFQSSSPLQISSNSKWMLVRVGPLG